MPVHVHTLTHTSIPSENNLSLHCDNSSRK